MKNSALMLSRIRIMSLWIISIVLLASQVFAQQGSRSHLKPSQALIGKWQSYNKSMLGFGDWKRGKNISEFRSDGTLIYYDDNAVTNLAYVILSEDANNGTLVLKVTKPSTNGSHIKNITFSSDRNVQYQISSFETKSVRTKKEKTVGVESKYEFIGSSY